MSVTFAYIHPHSRMTWSGRGRKPRWVEEWLEAGNSLEELKPQAPKPATAPEREEGRFDHLPLRHLVPSPTNPRRSFPDASLAEMAESIRTHGVLQPILVRQWPGEGYGSQQYEIIAGERRFRAATLAGLEVVPVLVRHLSDQQTVEFQVIENLHREDLHPLEEAEGYELLMQRHGYSAEELAAKIGKSKAYVYARLKLTALGEAGREAFRAGSLTASTALLAARIPGAVLQAKFVQEITGGYNGPMSYRDAARYAQNHYMLRLGEAPFDVSAADLLPDAAPCGACPKRSGNQPELFQDVTDADVCTDPDCFQAKREAWAARRRAEAEAAGKTIITGKAAEQIIPGYMRSLDYTQSGSGYVALAARCTAAEHLAAPMDDPEPVAPEEPDVEDDDDPAWQAFDAAMRQYDDDMAAWEGRRENALPTYRDLVAGAGIETVMVQHPRSGDLVEVARVVDLAPVLEAQGIQPPSDKPFQSGISQSQKEAEKKAKAETAYREALLDRIVYAMGPDAQLKPEDMKAIAHRVWERWWFDDQKRIARILIGEGTRDAIDLITRQIEQDEINLAQLLLTICLSSQTQAVPHRVDDPPEKLLAAADRWGVDPDAVRRQVAKGEKKGKKAKA